MAEEMKVMEPWVDAKDVAKHFKLRINTVRLWSCQGRIPHRKINGCLRFRITDIENYFSEKDNAGGQNDKKASGVEPCSFGDDVTGERK